MTSMNSDVPEQSAVCRLDRVMDAILYEIDEWWDRASVADRETFMAGYADIDNASFPGEAVHDSLEDEHNQFMWDCDE